jgi:hypothetical protein
MLLLGAIAAPWHYPPVRYGRLGDNAAKNIRKAGRRSRKNKNILILGKN